jgi:magnesium transporter
MLTTHATAGRPVWIDLVNPAEAEIQQTQERFSIRIPSREQLSEIESSSRLVKRDRQLYLSMPTLSAGQGDANPPPLGFVLAPEILVTIRYSEIPPLQQVAAQFETSTDSGDSAHVFASLLETMVDRAADFLEQQSAELAGTSRRVFRPHGAPNRDDLHSTRMLQRVLLVVGATGQRLSEIRQTLLGLQRIAPFSADSAGWLPEDVLSRLRLVQRDLASLSDFEAHLSNNVQFLLDATLGFINTEQNEIFKVLTIVSVVGIPPTLIASMYGMNFRNMPELSWSWGYAYALALIAISIIVPALWFKRRGWW